MVHEPSDNPTARRLPGKLEGKTPLAVFLVTALAIGTLGYAIFAHLEEAIRQEKYLELSTIGDLKVSQITGWLGERRADAAATTRDPILAREVQHWLQRGAPHDEAARRIESRLQGLREAYGYDKVILLDRGARPVLVAGDARHQHAHAESNQRAAEAMSAGQPLLADLHLEAESDGAPTEVNIDLYAPLVDADRRVVGSVYFQIDPYRFLFPFVQSWPTTSKSAETLLVRRDGDDVLYLNELRHHKDSALRFRLPLNTPDLPAAKALLGETGVIEGMDYRRVPVLAALRTVPGTSWHLVAKIDRAEVFAPMRNLAIGVGAMIAVLIAGAGWLVTLWWRKQHAQVLAMQFKAEFERDALSKHLDVMSRHANDAIFLYDESGRILEANERAVERYGYSRDELIGMSASQLRTPGAGRQARAEAARADEAGSGVYETLHRRKDGGQFPVEASLQVVDVEGRRLTQGIVRDITERKRAQETILRERNFIGTALDSMPGLFYLIDDQGRFLRWNKNFEMVSGYSSDEISRQTATDLFAEPDKGIIAEKIRQVFLTGEATVEADFVAKDRTRTPYFFTGRLVEIEQKPCLVGMGIDISARRRAEATLRESEERHRVIAESASEVILVIDGDSRIKFANPAIEHMFGYDRDELIGESLTALMPEELRSSHLRGLRRYLDIGHRSVNWKSVEFRGRHKDGREFPIEISFGEFVRDGKSAFAGFIRDITERKRAEARIERLARLKDALSGVNQAIVHAEGEQPLFDEICSIMVRRAGFDYAGIGIADPGSGEVRWAAHATSQPSDTILAKSPRSVHADRPEGRGPSGTAIRDRRHVVVQDYLNDPSTVPWHETARKLGIGSSGAFPVMRAGAAVGTINVYSKMLNAFDDEMLTLLDEAAQDVSFALDNLDREAQRKRINEALQESEARYRSLFNNMLNGIAYCKMQYDDHDRPVDFVYLGVNNAFETLTGLKNVAGKQVTEVIPGIKEAHPELFEIYGRVASTGIPATFEIDLKPLRRWFAVSVYSKQKGYFIAVFENITGRKHSELALRESEAKMRAIFDGALDGILVADMETRKFLTGNPAICRMLGYTLEEIVGIGVPDIHTEQDLPHAIEQFEKLLRGEMEMAVDLPLMRKDGSVFYADIKAAPIRLAGKDGLLGIFRDSTERKLADDRIRRLNRTYAVLSGINATIVRVGNREELFSEACRIAVEAGNFRAAWVGMVDRKANTVQPVAWHGLDDEYIRAMPNVQLVDSDSREPRKLGLAPLAVMERKPMVSADMSVDPRILLKKESLERGFRSLVVLPLLVADEVVGVLALYAGEVGFFDAEEMKLLNELAGDISFALDHIEKASKLDYLVFYDQLTGLANRALFLERVSQSIHAAGQAGSKFAVAVLNINRFRTVNESLGRLAGDALLRLVAQRLKTGGGQAGVGRISADHFALELGAVEGETQAAQIVDEVLRICFGAPFQVSDTELRLSANAGVALFPDGGTDAETLLGNAEAALESATDHGERCVFHTAALTKRTTGQLTLENQLRQALEKEEFVLHYQPKVDLGTRRIVGTEALIRWQSPEQGLVPPMKFIPLMEETGLILPVGAWALRRAARDHRRWVDEGLNAPRVAVNVSSIQLRQRDFVSAVEQAIIEGVAPTGIDLEITESLIMADIQGNIEKLKSARGLGVRIAIDDFGTGYSSLAYLAKLPVQTLKIDRSFIITMLKDQDTMTLVQTMISLAHSLKLTVVAEGVDEEEQAKMLHLLRCDEMQGYLFSKPVPFEAMTALLRQGKKA